MRKKILYCGDTNLREAARYLAGALKSSGLKFDYLSSKQKFRSTLFSKRHELFILSDYPSSYWTTAQLRMLTARIKDGASLWMIGGWGSFKGVDGNYGKTPLAEALPVHCTAKDDRVQGDTAYRIRPTGDYFRGSKFDQAPGICGYNRVSAKRGAEVLLEVETLSFNSKTGRYHVSHRDPLLVTWRYGKGRVVAFMTDLAPHWSGGLVDWGRRVKIPLVPGPAIEVGDKYLRFVRRILDLL